MYVSKEVDYGLRLAIILAEGRCAAKDLAERYQIPHNFVQLILAKLVRAGIVQAVPKTKGEYDLLKAPKNLSLLDIVIALEGPVDLMGRHYAKTHTRDAKFVHMLEVWHGIQDDVVKRLGGMTLDKMLDG